MAIDVATFASTFILYYFPPKTQNNNTKIVRKFSFSFSPTAITNPPPPGQKCLHLVVVVGLVRLCDPESNVDGSLTNNRATHAGKVKG
jgi:hypothetical protein